MKTRILLIEDDPGITITLRRFLASEGHEVIVEKRGDSGLARARADAYDVVLSDLKLPGLSGLDLVRELHEAKPRLPIILMTAHGTTETAIEATKRGAFDYLLKPFEMPDLLEVMSKALATSRLMSEPLAINSTPPRADEFPANSLQAMKTKILLVDDDPAVREMLGRVLEDQGYLALPAGNGQEALVDFPKLLQTIRTLLDEPAETRLARLAGRPADFHYTPGQSPRK